MPFWQTLPKLFATKFRTVELLMCLATPTLAEPAIVPRTVNTIDIMIKVLK